jgi:hypothetical protein
VLTGSADDLTVSHGSRPMLNRLGIIFVAAAVLLANAYCACAATRDVFAAQNQRIGRPSHPGCCGHDRPSHHDKREDSHRCGHCTGTVSASDASLKTRAPAPLVSPLQAIAVSSSKVIINVGERSHSLEHAGLSPPLPPRTLLNQFCSLIA